MNANVQDLPSREPNVLNKSTRFLESLSPSTTPLHCHHRYAAYIQSAHRNTTLPHPEVDTSANAAIEAPDANITRTHSRRYFLGQHHSSKNTEGEIKAKGTGLYDHIQYTDASKESRVRRRLKRTRRRAVMLVIHL